MTLAEELVFDMAAAFHVCFLRRDREGVKMPRHRAYERCKANRPPARKKRRGSWVRMPADWTGVEA